MPSANEIYLIPSHLAAVILRYCIICKICNYVEL